MNRRFALSTAAALLLAAIGSAQASTPPFVSSPAAATTKSNSPTTTAATASSETGTTQSGLASADKPIPFSWNTLVALADTTANRPWQNPDGSVPDFLLKLSYDQWRAIRFKPAAALWKDERLPFEVQFFHPGLFYNRMVKIHVVENGVSHQLAFNPNDFTYGDPALAERVRKAQLNYAGFRIHFPINKSNYKDEIAVFLGASYFRAVARGSQYGLSARGLSIDTALPSGEEFPWFKEFWLRKPTADAKSIRVWALLDSPSLAGAYQFDITPGDETVMAVKSRLFFRKAVTKLGVAPLTSMFLYGETENGRPGDYRPEVHDSDGLLVKDSSGWRWMPLCNDARLALPSLKTKSLAGFGLLQRDADFDHYQDLEARYDRRPSLWVAPDGDWGDGHVELVEIPTDSEINDNMVAYWVPDSPAPVEGQKAPVVPAPREFDYHLYWKRPGPSHTGLGQAVATRRMALSPTSTRFLIDFQGGVLDNLPADSGLSSSVTVTGSQLMERQLEHNPITGGWRLALTVALPPQETLKNLIAGGNRPTIRIKAYLTRGENLPAPLTETWVYDFQP